MLQLSSIIDIWTTVFSRRVLLIALVVTVLMAIGMVSLVVIRAEQRRSRDAALLSAVRQVQTGLQLYFSNNNGYPRQNKVSLGSPSAKCLGEQGFQTAEECVNNVVYLDAIPYGNYTYGAAECIGETGVCANYKITFSIEGEVGSLKPGIHAATPRSFE